MTKAKLTYVVQDATPDPSASPGIIVLQDHVGGTNVEQGRQVLITPSAGKPEVTVPNIVGKSIDQAQQILAANGLVLGSRMDVFSDQPFGQVLTQSPSPPARVQKGAAVSVTVSKGRDQAIVPNVIGMDVNSAQQLIQQRGLVANVQYEMININCDRPDGQVCRQTPAGGTKLDKGSTVTIVVAQETPSPSASNSQS